MFCWLSKLISARCLDDGKAVPAPVRAHFQQCTACRDCYDQQHRLIARLSAGAARREAPPFLHARILANLDRPASEAGAPRRVAPAWAVAGVIVVTVGALLLTFHFDQPSTPDKSNTGVSPAFADGLVPMTKLPSRDAVLSLTAKFDEPLEDEFRSVVDDARTALTSLSRNLVPEELLAQWR